MGGVGGKPIPMGSIIDFYLDHTNTVRYVITKPNGQIRRG